MSRLINGLDSAFCLGLIHLINDSHILIGLSWAHDDWNDDYRFDVAPREIYCHFEYKFEKFVEINELLNLKQMANSTL
jgi:hypothetical protein